MKRFLSLVLTLVMLGAVLLGAGCKQRTITVKTGEMVICTAGEVVSDNTKDVQVPESDVAKYSVTTRIVTCDTHQNIGSLYDAAQQAIAAGDLKTAAEKLKSVLALNPVYKSAAAQLKDIDAGKTPTADKASTPGSKPSTPGSKPTTSTATPDEPTDAISSLVKYVPDTLAGYSAQGIIADPASIVRTYLPTSGNADQLTVMAEQTVDAKAAAAMMATAKQQYPTSTASVTVGGKKGIFGVRDTFAIVVFTDGPIVVSVEIHARSGKAIDLKDAVIKAATAIAG